MVLVAANLPQFHAEVVVSYAPGQAVGAYVFYVRAIVDAAGCLSGTRYIHPATLGLREIAPFGCHSLCDYCVRDQVLLRTSYIGTVEDPGSSFLINSFVGKG